MTTVYLAGRYARRDELRGYALDLRSLGIDCDPAWLREPHDWDGVDPDQARRLALDDWRDIHAADMVIAFTDGPNTTRRGGRHVEVGIALGLGLPVTLVGPAENVFHHLPEVGLASTWDEALGALAEAMHRGWIRRASHRDVDPLGSAVPSTVDDQR